MSKINPIYYSQFLTIKPEKAKKPAIQNVIDFKKENSKNDKHRRTNCVSRLFRVRNIQEYQQYSVPDLLQHIACPCIGILYCGLIQETRQNQRCQAIQESSKMV